jgi:hypothetical protein
MKLRKKQSLFVKMIAQLIIWAYKHGYELTFGESFDDDGIGHMKNSNHYIRLAQDFNVFRNGSWLKKGEQFTDLGEYWESLGGSWGGRFSDGGHFSLEHEGKK